jgi:hypothetical protein
MRRRLCALLSAGLILFFSVLFNCAKTPNTPGSGSSDFNSGGSAGNNGTASNPSGISPLPTAQQDSQAAVSTQSGNQSLETALYTAASAQSVNVSTAEANYKAAIALNPNNTSAQFGAAVTELLSVNQNQVLQSVIDSFTIAPTTSLMKSRLLPLGISGKSFAKPGAILTEIASAPQATFPKISTVQETVKDTLLPEIVYALDRLSIIENDPTFAFKITPKMQGEAVGDTFILDNGEVYIIDAGLRVVRGILLTLISYNVDIDDNGSYQWITSGDSELIADNVLRLYQSSQFMALNSWGVASMQAAILNMRECIGKLQSAVNFIQNETGNQVNHIIQVSSLDSANSELQSSNGTITSISSLLDTATAFLSGPYTISNSGGSLTINVSAVFDNPIQDLKTKLPYIKWRDSSDWDRGDTFQPFDFVNATGAVVPDSAIEFPDYTFGGLFPDMTTRQDWVTLLNDNNQSPVTPTGSVAKSLTPSYLGYLRFPFAISLH